MEKRQAVEFLEYLRQDRNLERTIYGDALNMAIEALKAQLSKEGATKDATSDMISKFIDGLEETFAYIREREGGDSVCGLCEYDGAYIGQSGDWCNECPGFNRDDCFKLSDETRKKWTDEILKALPTVQPEPHEGHWKKDETDDCPPVFRQFRICSVCGAIETSETNYCPNCGSYNGGGRK